MMMIIIIMMIITPVWTFVLMCQSCRLSYLSVKNKNVRRALKKSNCYDRTVAHKTKSPFILFIMSILYSFLYFISDRDLDLDTNIARDTDKLRKIILVLKIHIFFKIEPSRGKTNNVVFEQIRHKPTCTSTENS